MTTRAFLLPTATLAALLSAPAGAQTTENRFGGSASAAVAYSNNPFSEADANGNRATSSPLVILDLTPSFEHLTERSVLSVTADANLQQYFRRYGRNDSYSGSVDYSLRPADRINTHLRLDLSSAVLGSYNSFVPPIAAVTPPAGDATGTMSVPGTPAAVGAASSANATPATTVPVSSSPLLTDVGLYGLRSRRRTGQISGDAGIGVTQSDTVTVSAYALASRYGNGNNAATTGADANFFLSNYEAYSGSLGYQRRVSAYLNVGVQGSASLFDYHSQGRTHVYSVQATASGRLSARWTLNGALGVSFVDGGGLRSTRQTSPSGSINLCRQGEFSNVCAQVARQVSPTGIDGSQYVTTAGFNGSRRLSERSDLSFSASYSDIGGNQNLLIPGGMPIQTRYAQATVGYNRQLRRRIRLIASANVRQLFGNDGIVGDGGRPVDYGGQVGVAYNFGELR